MRFKDAFTNYDTFSTTIRQYINIIDVNSDGISLIDKMLSCLLHIVDGIFYRLLQIYTYFAINSMSSIKDKSSSRVLLFAVIFTQLFSS